ncbi:lytic murein transglycosylase B [Thioflavicoccus mobilis 8321]|uniref:Lytic murein transglycosylase B n=1 Tax=Thioflavicoccus mobilis 8321 TaxID=765912 RepID=L0H0B6_9GAMM|nr:lytic murein transglycosylase B [Thioflavicoccus mobilis]AGA91487.1 lytic murein transglycosylase B [Thioflavicoccus mobilis 8321]
MSNSGCRTFSRLALVLVFGLSVLGRAAFAETVPEDYAAGKRAFVAEMAERYGFDRGWLGARLGQAHYDPRVIAAMTRPYEAQPWHRYRALFLTEERIRGGVAYWSDNAPSLARAEARYGVPPKIIVAILGVETNYGAFLGRYRVIDALTTLGFSYPPRADFFRHELEALLLLAREESIDASAVLGSYAGAVGKPQFIPSSYRTYAVDFDADGRRDLWGSDADAIGSVANYLLRHGWRRDAPIAVPASVADGVELDDESGVSIAASSPVEPIYDSATLRAVGVNWEGSFDEELRATPIHLEGGGPELWLGLDNFYAVTRYNHSNLYAMAVFQLGEAIESALPEH